VIKKITAYHEAGHAVAGYYLETQEKVHQVSVIQRGMAAGLTITRPETDDLHMSRNKMRESIIMLLGGRVAEAIVLDDICTGASNDIERATKIARNMVTKYGFSDKLGTVVYGSGEGGEVFLGRDYGHTRDYSEKIAAQIDEEVHLLVSEGYKKCEAILTENIDQLHTLANYLIEHEKIDGDDFLKLMNGELITEKSDVVDITDIDTDKKSGEVSDSEDDQTVSATEDKKATSENDDDLIPETETDTTDDNAPED